MKREEFEQKWNQLQGAPEVKEVEVKKVEPDISMTSMLDQFENLMRRSKERGEIKEEAYNELVKKAESLKESVAKMDADKLIKKDWRESISAKMKEMMGRFSG